MGFHTQGILRIGQRQGIYACWGVMSCLSGFFLHQALNLGQNVYITGGSELVLYPKLHLFIQNRGTPVVDGEREGRLAAKLRAF